MKLTTEYIGKRMHIPSEGQGGFFIPLNQTSMGYWVGEAQGGNGTVYPDDLDTWEFYVEPTLDLWSVWESVCPAYDITLGFICKKTSELFSLYTPDHGMVQMWGLNDDYFVNFYKRRSDLEVIAPYISEAVDCLNQINDQKFTLSANYITHEASVQLREHCEKQKPCGRRFYQWPANIALCRIVEKKIMTPKGEK